MIKAVVSYTVLMIKAFIDVRASTGRPVS